MERDRAVEEKDLEQLQQILKNVFNNNSGKYKKY